MNTSGSHSAPPDDRTGAAPERFMWPPRRTTAQGEDVRAGVSVPRVPSPPADGDQPLRALRPQATSAHSIWSKIERTWFGTTSPALLERAQEAAWLPSSPEEYCHDCGATVGFGESTDGGCAECRDQRLPWQRLVRLGEYAAPLDQWIREVKFTRFRRLGFDLGVWLGESLAAAIEHARQNDSNFPTSPPILVPVPMSLPRRLYRGIDHTLAIARGVAHSSGGELRQLLRKDFRPTQLDVAPRQRQTNVSGAFRPRRGVTAPAADRLVVIVDDVLTSGSTLKSAARVVAAMARDQGQQVAQFRLWCAVVGQTPAKQGGAALT